MTRSQVNKWPPGWTYHSVNNSKTVSTTKVQQQSAHLRHNNQTINCHKLSSEKGQNTWLTITKKCPKQNMLTKWCVFMEMAVTSFSQHHTVKVILAFVIECHMNKLCWSCMASLHENMRGCDCAESCMLLSSKLVNYNYLHEHTSLNKYLSVTMK